MKKFKGKLGRIAISVEGSKTTIVDGDLNKFTYNNKTHNTYIIIENNKVTATVYKKE